MEMARAESNGIIDFAYHRALHAPEVPPETHNRNIFTSSHAHISDLSEILAVAGNRLLHGWTIRTELKKSKSVSSPDGPTWWFPSIPVKGALKFPQ
jgi:hypothetical protein